MNKLFYKLVFCKRTGSLVAVSELTRGHAPCGRARMPGGTSWFGSLSAYFTPLAAAMFMALPAAASSLPAGGQISFGKGSVYAGENSLTIEQSSKKMGINWTGFDVAEGHSVTFRQPGRDSVALNRVTGNQASDIRGKISANGQVFLINPNGVVFGKNSEVNTAGIVATTRNLSDRDFLTGKLTLKGSGSGDVVNEGTITARDGGYIALSGRRVTNTGTLSANGGKVSLAAGGSVKLAIDGNRLLNVTVGDEIAGALVDNRGLVSADEGSVRLDARASDAVFSNVINNSGIVQARGFKGAGGSISVDGGSRGVVTQSGIMNAASAKGAGGSITLQGERIRLAGGSLTDASGQTRGGSVRVGGGYQGKDKSLHHARAVVSDEGSVTDVSAKGHGKGGTAILWSDEYTAFRGDIRARGGQEGGDGGLIETSSAGSLQAYGNADASAKRGRGGVWLLDPLNITITNGGADTSVGNSVVNNESVFTPTASGSSVSNTTVNNRLNSGTSVVITTKNDAFTENGNITVAGAISKTAGADASLTLNADGNIDVNNSITSTAGRLNLNLFGGNTRAGSTIKINNTNISLNEGTLTARAGNGATGTASIGVTNSTVKAGAITLAGKVATTPAGTGSAGVFLTGATTTLDATGDLSISGESTGLGVYVNGGQLKGQNISLTGKGTNNEGVKINQAAILSSVNTLTVSGTSNSKGVMIGDGSSKATLTGGTLVDVRGTSATNDGLYIGSTGSTVNGGEVYLEGNGVAGINLQNTVQVKGSNITLNGRGNGGHGITGIGVIAATGDVLLQGKDTGSGNAVRLVGYNVTGQNITVDANANTGPGMIIEGGSSLVAEKKLSLTGKSNTYVGILTGGTGKATLTGKENVEIRGSALNNSIVGVSLGNAGSGTGSSINGGDVFIQGSGKRGVEFTGLMPINGNNIVLDGKGAATDGLNLSVLINATGAISLTGQDSSTGVGISMASGSLLNAGNLVTLNGSGRKGIFGNNASIKGTDVKLTGTGTDQQGVHLSTENITGNNINIEGKSSTHGGVLLNNGSKINALQDINIKGDGKYGVSIDSPLTAVNIYLNGTGTTESGVILYNDILKNSGSLVANGTSKSGTGVAGNGVTINRGSVTGRSETNKGIGLWGYNTAIESILDGESLSGEDGIFIESPKLVNTKLTGKSLSGTGIFFYWYGPISGSVLNGTTQTGRAGVAFNFSGDMAITDSKIVGVNNSDKTGSYGVVFAGDTSGNLKLTGSIIEGSANAGDGIQFSKGFDLIDSAITGTSVSGDGIGLAFATGASIALNADSSSILSGSSLSGSGVYIGPDGNDPLSNPVNINGMTINGTSQTGSGVDLKNTSLVESDITGISEDGPGLLMRINTTLSDSDL
ncbi:TPA: filamentous hemagglutinin N-terminal domain-containing protein, partial [Enterobacter roggenkampii]